VPLLPVKWPFCELIVKGVKTIELRNELGKAWEAIVGKRLQIQAGKRDTHCFKADGTLQELEGMQHSDGAQPQGFDLKPHVDLTQTGRSLIFGSVKVGNLPCVTNGEGNSIWRPYTEAEFNAERHLHCYPGSWKDAMNCIGQSKKTIYAIPFEEHAEYLFPIPFKSTPAVKFGAFEPMASFNWGDVQMAAFGWGTAAVTQNPCTSALNHYMRSAAGPSSPMSGKSLLSSPNNASSQGSDSSSDGDFCSPESACRPGVRPTESPRIAQSPRIVLAAAQRREKERVAFNQQIVPTLCANNSTGMSPMSVSAESARQCAAYLAAHWVEGRLPLGHGRRPATGFRTYSKVLAEHDAQLQQLNTLLITNAMLPTIRHQVDSFHAIEREVRQPPPQSPSNLDCHLVRTPPAHVAQLIAQLTKEYKTIVELHHAHGLRQSPKTLPANFFDEHQDDEEFPCIEYAAPSLITVPDFYPPAYRPPVTTYSAPPPPPLTSSLSAHIPHRYTVVVKLTPDEPGEPPSAMHIIGAPNQFKYGPNAGDAGCFRARLFHKSVRPVSPNEHMKVVYFFRRSERSDRRAKRSPDNSLGLAEGRTAKKSCSAKPHAKKSRTAKKIDSSDEEAQEAVQGSSGVGATRVFDPDSSEEEAQIQAQKQMKEATNKSDATGDKGHPFLHGVSPVLCPDPKCGKAMLLNNDGSAHPRRCNGVICDMYDQRGKRRRSEEERRIAPTAARYECVDCDKDVCVACATKSLTGSSRAGL
jgi:hypothetical protein